MNKAIILLLIFGAIGSTYGALMDPVNNFVLQKIQVMEGKAAVTGDFICECPTNPPTICPLDNSDPFCNECDAADFGTDSNPGPFYTSADICDFDTTDPPP